MTLGKSVSKFGIDMGMSRLLLDDRSKTNNFQKRLLFFRPKLAANQGSSTGTVLDPILYHIGKRTKLDCSECSILNSVMKTSACP